MEYVNLTNHNIDMLFCPDLKGEECPYNKHDCRECIYGNIITIPSLSQEKSIKATPVEHHFKNENGIEYVTIDFQPNDESKEYLEKIIRKYENIDDDYILIGSIIAAQAFPEKIVGMVPVPGYERVPRNEKLIRSDKFSIFPKDK